MGFDRTSLLHVAPAFSRRFQNSEPVARQLLTLINKALCACGSSPRPLDPARQLSMQLFLLLYEGLVCVLFVLFHFVLGFSYFDLRRGFPFFLVSYRFLLRSNKYKLNTKTVFNTDFSNNLFHSSELA